MGYEYEDIEENIVYNSSEIVDESFLKLSLEDKLKQILSSKNNNTEITSISKEEYLKLKEKKREERKEKLILNEKDYLLQSSKIKIGKINNKLKILDKIINDIKRDAEGLLYSQKINNKIQELEKIQTECNGFKKMFIFLDDIDVDKLNNLAEERFK